MMDSTVDEHSPEVITAIQATMMASALCQKIRGDLTGEGSILKGDRSPVTIADFGSQAIVCKIITEKFPYDIIVAEEDSTELRKPAYSKILERVAHYIHDFVLDSSPEKVCSWIDYSSHVMKDRFWTLDPIDGTKGFLRGDQYAIALALIENGNRFFLFQILRIRQMPSSRRALSRTMRIIFFTKDLPRS